MRAAPTPPTLFTLAVAGQFIFGIVLALPGVLFGIPSWTGAVGLDVAAQSNLLAVFFTGQLISTAIAGVAVDHVGAQRAIAFGGVVLGAGFLMLARASSPMGTAAAIAVIAGGGSSINAATNTLVSVTFGSRRGAMLSMMGLAGAVGALTAPLLFAGPLASSAVSGRLLNLAVAALVVALLPMAVADAHAAPAGISFRAMAALARDRALGGLVALLSIEFGVEAVLAGWSAAYALAVLPDSGAGLIVTLYWGGLCLGRSATPAVLRHRSKLATVAGASALAAAGVAAMAVAPSAAWLCVAALAAGAAVGPLAPTIIAVAGDRYPRRTGIAIGVLLSAAQIGGMVLPWATGRIAIVGGFRAAMVLPTVAAVVLSAGAAAAWRRRAARLTQSEPA